MEVMMVVNNDIAKLWMARDAAQSGLYTLWAYNKPDMDNAGYFKVDITRAPMAVLLMSIHPAKFPWDSLKLDRGEVIEIDMGVVGLDRKDLAVIE
jgi:hypothetical protein